MLVSLETVVNPGMQIDRILPTKALPEQLCRLANPIFQLLTFHNTTTMNQKKEDVMILIADDDPDDRYLTWYALQETGFRGKVETMSSGEELLGYLSSSQKLPDLILLDLNMPRMDGFNVLEHIRSNVSYMAIPVHMLSISYTDLFKQKAKELGANQYHLKPDTYEGYEEIANSIRSALLNPIS